MPIAQRKNDAPALAAPAVPRIESPKAHSSVVDTRYKPLGSLVTFVQGRRYTVDYYSQVRGRDDTVQGQDPAQAAVFQQYRKISALEIRVTSPISSSQDQESKEFTINGEAIVHSHVIPEEGDMFAADAGDGREAVFQIKVSERLSIYKDSAYRIDFTLVYFSEMRPQERTDLENKVVERLHYLRDFMRVGQNPIITTEEFHILDELGGRKQQMIQTWYSQFFSKEFGTMLVPSQAFSTYDPFVVKAMRAMTTTDDHYNAQWMRILNVEDDDILKQTQLWDVITQRDIDLLPEANKKMGLVSTRAFSTDAMQEGIRYSGIERIVYPYWRNAPIDIAFNLRTQQAMDSITQVSSTVGTVEVPPLNDTITLGGVAMPLIKPVMADPYYVLSASFYEEGIGGKSVLEKLVEDALQREAVNPAWVLELAKSHKRWGGLEKFYYIPLMVFLIRVVLKDW